MKQKIIQTVNDTIVQYDKAAGRVTQHGAALGVQRHTAPNINADKNALVTERDGVNAAKTELANRQSLLRSLILTAIGFAILARDLLKPSLGRQHSAAWAVVGF